MSEAVPAAASREGPGAATLTPGAPFPARVLAGVPRATGSPRIGGVVEFDHRIWAVETTTCELLEVGGLATLEVPVTPGEFLTHCTEDGDGRLVVSSAIHEWTRDARPALRRGTRSDRDDLSDMRWQSIELPPGPTPVCAFAIDGALLVGFASTETAPGRHEGGGLAIVAENGDIDWLYRAKRCQQFIPMGLCAVDDHVLFVDQANHILCRLESGNSISVLRGRPGVPSRQDGFCSPSDLIFAMGTLWVADSRNQRVVRLDRSGAYLAEISEPFVSDPRRVLAAGGRLWIADVSRRNLVVHDDRGVSAPEETPTQTRLAYPRSVSVVGDRLVICDTCHDRVISVGLTSTTSDSKVATLSARTAEPTWPRAAASSDKGTLAICDGLTKRIRIVEGERTTELRALHLDGQVLHLSDPHDVIWLPDDELIASDGSGVVCRFDPDGQARWATRLEDPHCLSFGWGGRLFVTDPAIGRLFELDVASGDVVAEHDRLVRLEGDHWELRRCRACCFFDDLLLVANDSGAIAGVDRDFTVRLEWNGSYTIEGELHQLRAPRSMVQFGDELVTTDYRNHLCIAVPLRMAYDSLDGSPPAGSKDEEHG